MTDVKTMQYRAVLRVLEKQIACAELAHADPEFIECFKNVHAFLRSQRGHDIGSIISKGMVEKRLPTVVSDEAIAAMSADDADGLVSDTTTTRQELERLATYRFSMTRGELSALSNRRMLVDKLSSLIANERTHAAIERAAAGSADQPDSSQPKKSPPGG